jgi:WD40 repeat protein
VSEGGDAVAGESDNGAGAALAEWVDQVADRFDAAWQSGPPPRIADFLADTTGGLRFALLGELVKIDLEYRWRTGAAVKVEDYLADFPELAGPDGAPADDLVLHAHKVYRQFRAGETRCVRGPDRSGEVAAPRCRHCGALAPVAEGAARPATCPGCGLALNGGPEEDTWATALHGAGDVLGGAPAWPAPPGYEILGELGRGGMGVVYKARQSGLERVVALKMLLGGGSAGPAELARFRTEAAALARLQHPHIVQVFEVGEHDGQPFFSLELCAGGSLAKKLGGTPLPPREAATLVEVLARAMHAAHGQQVVHRDLKPANVLLTADGTPKVTDFGLAKKLDEAEQTLSGAVLGTPSYMAPEQARGQASRVGPATDTYALGTILYECLTGRPPFKGPSSAETMLQVIEDEAIPPRRLQPKVPPDLETVCLKAMAKSPAHRYATAGDLAADLRRYLDGQPILARPVGRAERLWRWCRRNPAVSGLAGAVALLVLAVIGASVGVAIAGAQAAESAKRAAAADRQANVEATAREQDQRRENLIQRLQLAHLQPQRHRRWSENAWQLLVDEGAAFRGNEALQTQAAALLAGLDAPQARYKSWRFPASSVAFDRTGRRLLLGGTREIGPGRADEPAKLLDSETGQKVYVSEQPGPGPVAFREDGTPLQLVLRDGPSLLLWDLAKQRPVREFRFGPRPDGAPVAMPKFPSLDEPVLALSADGELAAASIPGLAGKGALAVWNSLGERLFQQPEHATAVAFSPKGDFLATGSADGRVRCWSLPGGRPAETFSEGPLMVRCLTFSPDGRRLAAGGSGGSLTIWDRKVGSAVAHCRGSYHEVMAVTFSPDGMTLASAGRDTRLWDSATGRTLLRLNGDYVQGLAFSADGKKLAASGINAHAPGEVHLWELEEGRGIRALRGLSAQVERTCFSPDGKWLAALGHNRQVAIWDLEKGWLQLRLDVPEAPFPENTALAFSPGGDHFAFSAGKTATLWEVPSGRQVGQWELPTGLHDVLAFHPSRKLLLFRVETVDNEPPYTIEGFSWQQHPRICRTRELLGAGATNLLWKFEKFNVVVDEAAAPLDGSYFAVQGQSSSPSGPRSFLNAFDGLTGVQRWSVALGKTNHLTALDPSGRLLAYSTGEKASVCESVKMPSDPVFESVGDVKALSPEGAYWVMYTDNWDNGVILHRRGSRRPLVHFWVDAPVFHKGLVFNHAGKLIAWGNPDGSVTVCDIEQIRQRLSEVGLGWE